MFNTQSLFSYSAVSVPTGTEVIFVSDFFVEDYTGGAELTSQALISSSPLNIFKLHSKDVTHSLMKENADKYWIFGNVSNIDFQLIPDIITYLNYSVIEYDYKFCKYRSQEKHHDVEHVKCDCNKSNFGMLIASFLYAADTRFWMSSAQMNQHFKSIPELSTRKNIVLSSVFDDLTLEKISSLSQSNKTNKWIVLGSQSWVKGANLAEDWCKQNNKEYEIVWNVPYFQLLEKLASSQGFVYLPNGADTCPRMVIEAKLLGCQLILNEHVQHSNESWFHNDDIKSIREYLKSRPSVFWNEISRLAKKQFTISGYMTTYNCVKQEYPFIQSIRSLLAFCDEVVVVDGDSTDDTVQKLQELQNEFDSLKIYINPIDFEKVRFSVADGQQKAEARRHCTGDFCWQQDSDEIVHEDDYVKIKTLVKELPKNVESVALPVIEYWGGYDKVRVDVNPWKWRLSRNLPHITHGIPVALRKFDSNGLLFSAPGSDGCDLIYSVSFQPVPFVNFMTRDVENVRISALHGDKKSLQIYENWLNEVADKIPGVFHYSWFDIVRKIKTYRDYWTKHWVDISGEKYVDSAKSNMMFDKPWSEVTEEMIEARAKEFASMGGWIWHHKWDGRITPWVTINKSPPLIMSR